MQRQRNPEPFQGRSKRTESGPEPSSVLRDRPGKRRQTPERPANAGLSDKRLKGLEPSTFCMASRRSSQLSYSRKEARV